MVGPAMPSRDAVGPSPRRPAPLRKRTVTPVERPYRSRSPRLVLRGWVKNVATAEGRLGQSREFPRLYASGSVPRRHICRCCQLAAMPMIIAPALDTTSLSISLPSPEHRFHLPQIPIDFSRYEIADAGCRVLFSRPLRVSFPPERWLVSPEFSRRLRLPRF